MSEFFCYGDAVIDLIKRGYKDDFVMVGNNLLWIQQKLFVRNNDFSILECHRSGHPDGQIEDLVVLGVLIISANIKGILLNPFDFALSAPPIIISKLNKMSRCITQQNSVKNQDLSILYH